jgi:sugar lactone lactonase YvrE
VKELKRVRTVALIIAFLVWYGARVSSNAFAQDATSCASPALGGPFSADSSGEVFVASRDAVARFAPGAHGNVAPAAILCGANTQLAEISALVVAGKYLYVATSHKILVFSIAASGNAQPESQYGLDAFKSEPPWNVHDLAVDTRGNILALIDDRLELITRSGNPNALHLLHQTVSAPTHGIAHVIFDSRGRLYYSDATSNVMLSGISLALPFRKILNTGGSDNFLALDADGRLYIGVNGGVILVVTGSTNSTLATAKLTAGSQLEQIEGVSTDADGRLYVPSCSHDSIASVLTFSRGAHGSATPIAVLSGPKTGLVCEFPGR